MQTLNDMDWAMREFFSPAWVRASLVVALLSASLAVLVCAYYGRRTQKTSFVLWTGGWSFYAVYLVTVIVLEYASREPTLHLARVLCAGLSALFFLLGGMHLTQYSVPRWKLITGVSLVLVGSYAAVEIWQDELWGTLSMVGLMALAAIYAGWRQWNQQDRRSRWLAMGFVFWGANLVFMPWLALWPFTKTIAYLGSALLTLSVAIGLIIREQNSQIEQRYRKVVDAANAAIFVIDLATLEIRDANKAAERLVKRTLSELKGVSFLDLCPDLRAGAGNLLDHRTMFSAVFKPYNEVILLRPNAQTILCEGDTHKLEWRGRPALQINLREVEMERKTGQMVRRAEKMSSLGQLIAGVAHELNNPLAVVLGYAQLINKQDGLDEKTRAMNRKVLHESERAARIVRDLLSFARPCEPKPTAVDINNVVANVLGIREADLQKHVVTVSEKLWPDLPPTKADPMQIEQVLTNLVANAIHAMAEQSTARVLTISTALEGAYIRITVADSGPGIPADLIGRIFDPFFTTKAPGKGTGLGLSICQTIMQEHRGKIWAQSEPGQGARFVLELPFVACEPAPDDQEPSLPAAATPIDPMRNNQRILVVDDEEGIRDVMTDVLGSLGYGVEAVATGQEALHRLSSSEYNLVISDLCMPGIDGEELWRLVGTQNPGMARRIVFLTGDTVSPQSREFLEATGNRWLTKPFDIADVESTVQAMLASNPLRALTDRRPAQAVRRYYRTGH